jgi:hypothetical protein
MPFWMISETEAAILDSEGWIVSSSRENRCGQMKWTHGGSLSFSVPEYVYKRSADGKVGLEVAS